MNLSPSGARLIHSFESLELAAYPDPASALGRECTARRLAMRDYRKIDGWEAHNGAPWTIGWGHTGSDVDSDTVWTAEQADEAFALDIARFEADVNELGEGLELEQEEFDALVSFAYNVGTGNLRTSTLLKKLRANDGESAAEEFLRWNKAGGQVMAGLTRRRNAERAMFLGGDWTQFT